MMTKRSLALSPLSSHPDHFKVVFTRGLCTRPGISPGDGRCSCHGRRGSLGSNLACVPVWVEAMGVREQCQPWEQWRLHHSSDSGSQGRVSAMGEMGARGDPEGSAALPALPGAWRSELSKVT